MPSFSFIKKKASDVASAASSTASTTVSTIKHGAVQAAETTGGVAAATTQQLQETTHTAYVTRTGYKTPDESGPQALPLVNCILS